MPTADIPLDAQDRPILSSDSPRTVADASGTPRVTARAPAWIAPAFFCSGFAALVYQVVWQRVLFTSFGINIEAVTVVVTAFLVGLGFGSLLGGGLSTHPRRLLLMFSLMELSVGVYGIFSVPLFRYVAEFSAGMSSLETALLTLVLVIAPTLLMGATLPLLVAYVVHRTANVGMSVGWLYFVNTLGSALASIATVVIVLGHLGELHSVWLAALVNFGVGTFVLTRYLGERGAA